MTHPIYAEFWPEKWSRNGCTATRDQMARAYTEWCHSYMSAASLASCLMREGATTTERHWQGHRLADAMLQRARKAGHIAYSGGLWRVVP